MRNHPKTVTILGLLLALFLPTVLFSGCSDQPTTGQSQSEQTVSFAPAHLTPDKVKTLFQDSVGQGKPVVVDFSSRFCYECRLLKPKLEALAEKFPNIDFKVVSIQSKEDADKALLSEFQVVTVPYVAFIDGTGKIQKVFVDDATPETLEAAATQLLPPAAQATTQPAQQCTENC